MRNENKAKIYFQVTDKELPNNFDFDSWYEERLEYHHPFGGCTIKPMDKTVIRRIYEEDKTECEVAREMGCSRQWISEVKKRALTKMRYNEAVLDMPKWDMDDEVQELPLSIRARNALRGSNVRTVKELFEFMTSGEWKNTANMGTKTAREIWNLLIHGGKTMRADITTEIIGEEDRTFTIIFTAKGTQVIKRGIKDMNEAVQTLCKLEQEALANDG